MEDATIQIDEVTYPVSDMSDKAKQHVEALRFIEQQILQRSNELAIADTARIGYENALKESARG